MPPTPAMSILALVPHTLRVTCPHMPGIIPEEAFAVILVGSSRSSGQRLGQASALKDMRLRIVHADRLSQEEELLIRVSQVQASREGTCQHSYRRLNSAASSSFARFLSDVPGQLVVRALACYPHWVLVYTQ